MSMLWALPAGLILLLALGLLHELLAILRARVPRTPRISVVGAPDGTPAGSIPRIVWSYWDSDPPPGLIQACWRNWQDLAPDHEFRCLNADTVQRWLSPDCLAAQPRDLPAFRYADWLRLQLLQAHGGIWIDSSSLLLQDLAWVQELQRAHQVDYVGYYIAGSSASEALPIVENWFMAAVPGSRFIAELNAEFCLAITMGEAAYLDQLRERGLFEAGVQRLHPRFHQYLIMHVAASVLMAQHPMRYRMALLRAEDDSFAYLHALRWRKRHMLVKLALLPCPSRYPRLLKLRGPDRRLLERALARGLVRPRSLLGRFLRLDAC